MYKNPKALASIIKKAMTGLFIFHTEKGKIWNINNFTKKENKY